MDDIFIILLLILLNGVFSMSEIALISARKSRLASDAKQGSKGAMIAMKLAEDPDRFLSTIQIGITLIGILTGLYSGAALAEDVGTYFQKIGLMPKVAHVVAQVIIVTVVTYLSIVIGELVPKRIGLAVANSASKIISRPMYVLSLIAMPAVWLLSESTSLVIKLLGLKDQESNVTEDEIKSLIHDGAEVGEVKKVEQEIMERVLVLGDLRVSTIMTPKHDVVSLRLEMTADEVKEVLSNELHNSYPVYSGKAKSKVLGVVSLKKLILSIDLEEFDLRDAVMDADYFPETMSVYDALDRMKTKGVHFALVCDEFGEMTGVVTPSDILRGLVGAMPQQTVLPGIIKEEDGDGWIVDAHIQFYDFLNYFELENLYKPASYSTLGGFILEELRRIPEPGEELLWNNINYKIISVNGAKIGKIRVKLVNRSDTDKWE